MPRLPFQINPMAKLICTHLFKSFSTPTVRTSCVIRKIHSTPKLMITVGEAIPSVDLYEGVPGTPVNIAQLCKGKVIVMLGVPGAFTPSCSRTHLPGYIEMYDELKKKGVDEIVCVSVNDAFVMDAWGKMQEATGKVRMLADPNADFTRTIGLDIYIVKLGGIRSKRYAMVIKNGIIKTLNVEPDGTGLSCSLAKKLVI